MSRLASEKDLIKELQRITKMLVRRDLELTMANDRLSELDQIKSEFVSIVAHQLRTPLSEIKWTINMFLNKDLGKITKLQKNYLKKVYNSNEKMLVLISDLLNVDKIETGIKQFNFCLIDFEKYLLAVLADYSVIAKKNKIKIIYAKNNQKLPLVKIDLKRMHLALDNLLDNAVKYSPPNSKIFIKIHKKKHKIIVSIEDHGIGIPEKERINIFTRFYRASNAVRKQTNGTGLGLIIAKTIIEKHHGQLWFTSKEGKGTTFYFTFPF